MGHSRITSDGYWALVECCTCHEVDKYPVEVALREPIRCKCGNRTDAMASVNAARELQPQPSGRSPALGRLSF